MRKKILVILGPTAVGKSALAIKIAKMIDGEIISADSRQVYKGLDIGTGKITKKEMKNMPHHMIDIVSPKKKYSVYLYKKKAEKIIKEIISRNKTPIICGGTGFYIDAITKGLIFPHVPPNKRLRTRLEKVSAEKLLMILEKLDLSRANVIKEKNEINNKPRLVRSIEIAKSLGKMPKINQNHQEYCFVKMGIYLPKKLLEKKIQVRVKKMFKNGLLGEIEKHKMLGIPQKRMREFGFEYFNPSYDSVVKKTIKYSKRQMTWFKRDNDIMWFNSSKKIDVKKISNLLK